MSIRRRTSLTLAAMLRDDRVQLELRRPDGTLFRGNAPASLSDLLPNLETAQRILQRLRHHAGGNREDTNDLLTVMDAVSKTLLPAAVLQVLIESAADDLIVAPDPSLDQIPWELLRVGDDCLCRRFALGRVRSLETPPRPELHIGNAPARLSVIANADFSLPGTVRESDLLTRLFRQQDAVKLVPYLHSVTMDGLVAVIEESDWLHFAGHASRNESGEIGWRLADGRLGAREIRNANLSRCPRFIFAHACASAVNDAGEVDPTSMALAFLSAGASHFLGTIVPVLDEPCRNFARAFYEAVLRHEPVGMAVRTARRSIQQSSPENDALWATYILHGDPRAVLIPSHLEDSPEPLVTFPIPCTLCGRPIRSRHGLDRQNALELTSAPICRICARRQREHGVRSPPDVL